MVLRDKLVAFPMSFLPEDASRARIREAEAARAGKKAYIAAKMNALLEPQVIAARDRAKK